MDMLNKIFIKYKELILYIFFGGLTTAVNWIVYFVLYNAFSIHYILSDAAAWVAAVLFAFFTNKSFVFNSNAKAYPQVLKEMFLFFGSRLITLFIEIFLLYTSDKWLHMNVNISKIIIAVIVLVLNYVFSKIVVFRK